MTAKFKSVFLRIAARVILPCHEVTRLLSQGMDRPLPWYVRWRLRLHFAGCVWCRRYAEQLRQIRFFSRMFPEKAGEFATAVLPGDGRERIRAALNREIVSRPFPGPE